MFALRECLANWASRAVLTATLAGLIAALLISVAYIEIAAADDALRTGDELVTDGYTTLLIGRNDQLQPTLTATDCTNLDGAAGVVAATWTTQGPPTRLWSRSGPELPTTVTGTGLLNLLAASPDGLANGHGEQLLIDQSSDIAGHNARPTLAFQAASGGIETDLFPTNLAILGQGATAALIEIAPDTDNDVDSCVVLTNRTDRDTVRAGIETAFAAEQGYSLQWALPNADRFDDPIITYRERPSRYAWLVTAAAGLVIIAFALRLRRADHAFYSISGLTHRRLRTLTLIETLGPIAIAALLTAATLAISTAVNNTPTNLATTGWTAALRALIALALSAAALCSLIAAGINDNAQTTLKDK